MAGISVPPALGKLVNRFMLNCGNELQNKEISDATGLEMYDAVHRMYDPQLGKFHQIDALADICNNYSPYNFTSDNPILRNDPLGLEDTVYGHASVTVVGHKKHYNNWFGWPLATLQERKHWDDNQYLYYV